MCLAGCADPLRDVPRMSDIAPQDAPTTETPTRPGLFARLFSAESSAPAAPTPTAAPQGPGLFSTLFGGSSAPETDPDDIPAGTALPFGQLGRVCNLPRSQRGDRITRHAGLTLWDSAPNSTTPRPHYITGFADGCARSFTAALAMRGEPLLHETARYTSRAPYSATDEAYEQIKHRVCGVARGAPCGDRMDRLERQVTMISGYEAFGSGARTVTILLHNKTVAAVSLRTR